MLMSRHELPSYILFSAPKVDGIMNLLLLILPTSFLQSRRLFFLRVVGANMQSRRRIQIGSIQSFVLRFLW